MTVVLGWTTITRCDPIVSSARLTGEPTGRLGDKAGKPVRWNKATRKVEA
jgi:hypothetical protein